MDSSDSFPTLQVVGTLGDLERTRSVPPLDPVVSKILLDRLNALVAICDPDFHVEFCNRAFSDFLGLASGHVHGRRYDRLFVNGIEVQHLRPALLRGEAAQVSGWRSIGVAENKVFLEETFLPFVEDGELKAIGIFAQDQTTLKEREAQLVRMELELERSKALQAAIFDHAMIALLSMDAGGSIVEFNPAAELIFERSRSDALGLPIGCLVVDEGGTPYPTPSEGSIGTRLALLGVKSGGARFPIEMVLWRTRVGSEAFHTASILDMTAQHVSAREVERQRQALQQSQKLTAMGGLLAGVAHELNNPLAIAMGRSSLLVERSLDDNIKADAHRILDATKRCGRIVQTFLSMARGRPQQRVSVNLNKVAKAAIDMLHYTYRTHGIELKTRLDDKLPDVLVDGDQIGQVVMNLLINAQQALSDIDLPKQVLVATGVERLATSPHTLWLRVSDSGGGVPSELAERIFEPFMTTKPEGSGTGLGLSVSRSIARAHGGDLRLESSGVLSGATFCLSLPAA